MGTIISTDHCCMYAFTRIFPIFALQFNAVCGFFSSEVKVPLLRQKLEDRSK